MGELSARTVTARLYYSTALAVYILNASNIGTNASSAGWAPLGHKTKMRAESTYRHAKDAVMVRKCCTRAWTMDAHIIDFFLMTGIP